MSKTALHHANMSPVGQYNHCWVTLNPICTAHVSGVGNTAIAESLSSSRATHIVLSDRRRRSAAARVTHQAVFPQKHSPALLSSLVIKVLLFVCSATLSARFVDGIG